MRSLPFAVRDRLGAVAPASILLTGAGALLLLLLIRGVRTTEVVADDAPDKFLLGASVEQIDFGTVAPGGTCQETFWLHNPGIEPIQIAAIETGCDCARILLDKNLIPPGERVQAVAAFDFATEREFRGPLGMDATGYTARTKEIAFQISLRVNVAEPPPARTP